jgi:Ca2+-transporting ATPase
LGSAETRAKAEHKEQKAINWHQMEPQDVLDLLGTGKDGLSAEEVAKRAALYGKNELLEGKKRTAWSILLGQFKDFLILILIAAAIISGFIGEPADTAAILVIVVLNGIIGFVQEYRAEKAMAALKMMAAPQATVKREGTVQVVPAADLVPGDLVFLEAGNIVPADLRLVEAVRLRAEEAALTGESLPVDKNTAAISKEHVSLGDRRNMAYKGTVVTSGRGAGVVVATGMQTELGRIATLLQEEEEVKTPLQKRLARFGKSIALAVFAICAIVFIMGVFRGEEIALLFLTAISLAVAAVPEALPAVITISLAFGAKKLAEKNALIRRLPAVETLGSVTYICSDKTGTLTLNKMTVEDFYFAGQLFKRTEISPAGGQNGLTTPRDAFFVAMAISNDATKGANGEILGDPTETALYSAAEDAGYTKEKLIEKYPRVAEIPFDSERKLMTTIHRDPEGGYFSLTKGALESVLARTRNVLAPGGEQEPDKALLAKTGDKMAGNGLRVLAFALRKRDRLPEEITAENIEKDLTLLGLAGMLDPPREEAKEAVRLCKSAGIKPVMITGDHPLTARVIATRLGILDDPREILTGPELDRLTTEELKEKVTRTRVYARVAPEQKLKIVKALQEKGEFVAMTGDGVNDAPALKRADIGIAMGITGTDVSKEASHMILLDDNFATIVKAVREGRRIYDNIRKFIRYAMTTNSGEIWTIFLAPFFGLPIPLLPIHILWINLVTDGLPGLALAAEPEEKEVMKRPPRHPAESIFAHGMAVSIIWVGFLIGCVSLLSQAMAISSGSTRWQTIVFTVLCLSQMSQVLAIRSEKESLFKIGLFSNKPLLGAVLLTFLLQMAVVYVPPLQEIFKTASLSATELAVCIGLSSLVFFAIEINKWVVRRQEARLNRACKQPEETA